MATFHTEFKGYTIILGVWGHVKIMILEVRFLLTNFYSTSAIFKTLYVALNKIKFWALEGDIPGLPPPV